MFSVSHIYIGNTNYKVLFKKKKKNNKIFFLSETIFEELDSSMIYYFRLLLFKIHTKVTQ